MKLFQQILILYCFVNLTSCIVDEQCRQNKNVALYAGFYHVVKNQTTGIITKSTLTIDSLTIKGLKFDSIYSKYVYVDSILYNKTKSINKINIPLHKFVNVSKYEVTFNTKIDTVTILHTNSDEYLSLECGCLKTHVIDSVQTTNHFIDSIKISNNNVNTNNAENIRIYK